MRFQFYWGASSPHGRRRAKLALALLLTIAAPAMGQAPPQVAVCDPEAIVETFGPRRITEVSLAQKIYGILEKLDSGNRDAISRAVDDLLVARDLVAGRSKARDHLDAAVAALRGHFGIRLLTPGGE
ncbi:MAG TPA: hypothetical protein VM598_03245, partial [Bdellovibrionota bacterium]|nr:hypothetical protein [Bdellovibrionota bacterium]